MSWLAILETVVAAAHLTGLLSAAHAIWHTRSSQGAIAWTMALVMFPYLALPLYWTFGRRRFQGYRGALRAAAREQAPRLLEELRRLRDHGDPCDGERQADLAVLSSLAGLPWTGGNRLELLVDGERTFDALYAEIARATAYVLVQFYIIRADGEGRRLADALKAAAARGVRVHLLYDEIGSIQLPARYDADLARAGVRVSSFFTRRGPGNRFQVNFRNHRKVAVIDGRVAFTGGHNVGDEYLGRDPALGRWRDTHVRVEGPAALALEMGFLADWYWATREHIPVSAVAHAVPGAAASVLVYPSGPIHEDNRCEQFVVALIGAARRRLWIASPYLVPGEAVLTALKLAARRGVDVRLLLPEKFDHFFVNMAAFSFIPDCVRAGIAVHFHTAGFMHQKVMLVDEELAAVGTLNLDNRSIHLNFEVTLLARDAAFAREVAAMLRADLELTRPATADELDRRGLWFRFWVKFARLLEPVL